MGYFREKRTHCKLCGAKLKQAPVGRKRKFCSDEHQRQWWIENREEAGKVYTYTCQNCGKEYQTLYSNRDTCCSRECGFEWHSKQALIEKECLSCGQVFEEKSSGPGYCSDECQERGAGRVCKVCGTTFYGRTHAVCCASDQCKRKVNRERFRAYKKAIGRNWGRIEVLTCEECGKRFEREVYNRIPQFCSKKCSRKNWAKSNPEKARAMKAKGQRKRRARKYGNGPVQDIDFNAVCNRDGWRCGICGEKVNPHLKFPHLMSATLDHIIPLARGGTHTWQNVQLVHFICNSEKRDVGGGQLRLGITVDIKVNE